MLVFLLVVLAIKFQQRRVGIIFFSRFINPVAGARVGALVAEIIRRGDFDDMAAGSLRDSAALFTQFISPVPFLV